MVDEDASGNMTGDEFPVTLSMPQVAFCCAWGMMSKVITKVSWLGLSFY